jgi:hypothetical protein
MVCVCCGRKIGRNETLISVLGRNFTETRKRYYSCSRCEQNGKFDVWMGQNETKLNQYQRG